MLSAAQSRGSTKEVIGITVVECRSCKMVKKRGGLLLKRELNNLSFLESYPEVQRHFLNAGCMEFVKRLQSGYHQVTAEAFTMTFDGNKSWVGSVEIKVDEKFIASATGLPMTGQKWFKTTALKH
jgi:hypothetical protein